MLFGLNYCIFKRGQKETLFSHKRGKHHSLDTFPLTPLQYFCHQSWAHPTTFAIIRQLLRQSDTVKRAKNHRQSHCRSKLGSKLPVDPEEQKSIVFSMAHAEVVAWSLVASPALILYLLYAHVNPAASLRTLCGNTVWFEFHPAWNRTQGHSVP